MDLLPKKKHYQAIDDQFGRKTVKQIFNSSYKVFHMQQ